LFTLLISPDRSFGLLALFYITAPGRSHFLSDKSRIRRVDRRLMAVANESRAQANRQRIAAEEHLRLNGITPG